MKFHSLILVFLSIAGCAGSGNTELAADHPAHPDAKQAATTDPHARHTSVANIKLVPYPLQTCLVGDEDLGSMGEPHVIGYQGREIKFCCKSCETSFREEPAKYLKKLDDAAKTAKPATSAPAHDHSDHK